MKKSALLLALAFFCGASVATRATNNYEYKPGEYVVISDGVAPSKQYEIAAHGSGELGYDHFHLYLMDGHHKKIGPLEEIREILDTGADAYHASWSPDSRHVAISYRQDRHLVVTALYRIEKGRAFAVKNLTLLNSVPGFNAAKFKKYLPSYGYGETTLDWKNASRFELWQKIRFTHIPFKPEWGKFFNAEKEEGSDPPTWAAQFSAESVCELLPGDQFKVVEIKPGEFD